MLRVVSGGVNLDASSSSRAARSPAASKQPLRGEQPAQLCSSARWRLWRPAVPCQAFTLGPQIC